MSAGESDLPAVESQLSSEFFSPFQKNEKNSFAQKIDEFSDPFWGR